MWTIFKITNIALLFISTYVWITTFVPMPVWLVAMNALLLIEFSFLPFKTAPNMTHGRMLLAIVALAVWSCWTEGASLAAWNTLMYLPALYLVSLPKDYQKDLLHFVTKWFAVLLAVSLSIYGLDFIIPIPSLGQFVHLNYEPFDNYFFFIKYSAALGTIPRFNAFFLEPGHLALFCCFLLMANRFEFKRMPLLWILAICVVLSFSLAGYLLAVIGFILLKINSIPKAIAIIAAGAALFITAQHMASGNNALNEMIIERLKYDENKGIKGNNRFYNNTDNEYKKASDRGDLWTGVAAKARMDLIGGAGYKVYILKYGLIGSLLALLFYLSVIPAHPDVRYTVSFLIVLILCFLQRSYPYWYSWIFPYIVGIYIAAHDRTSETEE